jgi:hypothetical protein
MARAGRNNMEMSKTGVRVALTALAFGLVQGCTALPHSAAAGAESFTEEVTRELYTSRVYMTGSRIPRKVDARRSMAEQSTQPLRVLHIVD